jgi:type IX secretion system PorP/SprF family membrane protein
MKKTLFIILAIIYGNEYVAAQDIHFSQVNFSPLTLNPALAGANYDFQTYLNYRTQWNSVASPFKTVAASVDARLNSNKRSKKAHFAMGLNFFNDQSGETRISTNNLNLTFATHVLISENHTIGAGIYAGWLQRSILPYTGKWDSQYNGMYYDPLAASGEQFQASSFSAFDAGAGIVYTFSSIEQYMRRNDSKQLNVGFAAYHVNRPKYSFLDRPDERLYVRFSAFVNGSFGIKNSRMLVEPGIYFHQQGSAREIFFGTYGRYIIKGESKITGFIKKTSVALGLFLRNQDALVTKFHFEWNGFGLGASYDVNVSRLAQLSRARGGVELSLRWIMNDIYFNRTSSIYRNRKF